MTQRLINAARAVVDNWERGDLAGAVRYLDGVLDDITPSSADERDLARQRHCNDEINVDEDALVSRCGEPEDGLWVQAWVWIPGSEPKPEPEYGKGVLNEYTCPACGTEWESEWDCACDDDCPSCGLRAISPDGDGS